MLICMLCIMLTACGENKVAKASVAPANKVTLEAARDVANKAKNKVEEYVTEEEDDSVTIDEFGIAE